MSWRAIARKDVRDSLRSRTLWVLLGLLLLLLGGIAYAAWLEPEGTQFDAFVDLTAISFGLVIPLFAIALGYKSVIDERESGTIAIALSFPHTRGEFIGGKFLGRAAVLTLPILVSMVAATGIALFLFDSLPLASYLLFVVLTIVYGLAFLAIALAVSMWGSTGRRVTAGAFGAYILLVMLWADLVELLLILLWRFDARVLANPPDWAQFLQMASPLESYNRLVTTLFDSTVGAGYVGPDTPWFVEGWVAVLVLVGWIVLSLAVGYDRFRRAEL